jgi:hypothetical protein
MELSDGEYDAMVINVTEVDDDSAVALEVAITSGPAKGSTVVLRATGLRRDPLSLLGLPARLRVVDGRPDLALDE